jgi:hypothetical protein
LPPADASKDFDLLSIKKVAQTVARKWRKATQLFIPKHIALQTNHHEPGTHAS